MSLSEFTDQNFDSEVLHSPLQVLVFFSATWCGPCKQVKPIIEKIAGDFGSKVKVGQLDIDDAPVTARKYGVKSVPTCVVFQSGQKMGVQAGLTNREMLLKMLGL